MAQGDTLLNALIGAIVSVVLAFLPFSTVLGGAVAGYLQRGSREDGFLVGAYSGLIAAIPILLVVVVFGSVFFLGAFFEPRAAIGFVFVFFALAVALVYSVGLSALGGYLGAYLASEYEF
ncbi:MAG: DUF5518 domain-containing protein [Halanaeroarchaeum sp.]